MTSKESFLILGLLVALSTSAYVREDRSKRFETSEDASGEERDFSGENGKIYEDEDEDEKLLQRDSISKRDAADYNAISFLDLVKTAKDTIVESNFGGLTCTFQAKFTECIAEFLPVKGSCPELPSLTSFLARFFPEINMLKASSNLIHSDKFDIEQFTIERCKDKFLNFQLFSDESINAVERYMVVNDAKLTLGLPFEATALDLASVTVAGFAYTSFEQVRTRVAINKKENSTMIEFKVDPLDKVTFAAMAKKFHFDINDIVSSTTGPAKEALNLKDLAFTNANIKGYLVKGQAFEFLVSGKVSGCPLLEDATSTNLVVQRYMKETGKPKVAIFSVYNKPVYGMLMALTMDNELPELSIFSNVKKFVFTAASESFQVINLQPAKSKSLEFTSGRYMMETINPGIEVRFKIPKPAASKREFNPPPDTDNNIITVNVTKDYLRIGFPEDIQGKVEPLVNTIWNHPNLKANELPLPSDVTVRLQNARVGIARPRHVNITFMVTSTYIVVPGLLTLSGVYFKVTSLGISPTDFAPWKLDNANQRETVNGTIDLHIVEDDGSYCVQGDSKAKSIKDVEKAAQTMFMPKSYRETFNETFEIPVKDVLFESPLSKEKANFVRYIGSAILLEGKIITLDGIFTMDNDRSLAIGLHFSNHRLNDMLEYIYGKRVLKTCWLEFLDAGFVFSEKEIPNYKLKSAALSEVKIKPGVHFAGKMNLRLNDCEADQLCEFINRYIKNTIVTTFTGSMSPSNGYRFSAPFGATYQFSKNVLLTDNTIVVSGKDEASSSTKLIGKLKIPEANVEFEASLSMSENGRFSLNGQLTSPWKQPLGFPLGTLNDVTISQDITQIKEPDFLYFKGEFLYGEEGAKRLKSKVTLNYDLTEDEQHYFFGYFERLSLREFANAWNLKFEHKVLDHINFNASVLVQYTSSKTKFHVREIGDAFLPQKLTLRGMVELFGEYIPCSILDRGYGFRIKCYFKDLDIQNGFVGVRKGGRHSTPTFVGKIRKERTEVGIKGKFNLLGISGVNVLKFLPDETAEIEVEGKLLNVIGGKFKLTSKYAALDDMVFHVEGTANEEASRKCIEGIHMHVSSLKNTFMEAKRKLEEKRTNARNAYDFIHVENEEIKNLLFAIESKIYKKSLILEKKRSGIQRSCVQECVPVCYHGVAWNPQCAEVRDHTYGCTGWSSCSSKAANTSCIATCEAEKVASNVAAYEENAQIKGLIDDYQEGRVQLEKKDKLLQKAKKIKQQLNEAQSLLGSIESLVNEAINITSEEMLKEAPIAIEHIKISGGFNQLRPIYYPFVIKVGIARKTFDYASELAVEGDFFTKFGKMVINSAIPTIKDLFYLHGNLSARFLRLDNLITRFENIAKKEDKEDDYENLPKDDDAEARDYIPSSNEVEFYKIASEIIPQYSTMSDETRFAFFEKSPWGIAARHTIETEPGIAMTGSLNRPRSTGDPCSDISNVILDYEDIVKGMDSIKDHHETSTAAFESKKKTMISQAKTLSKDIAHLGSSVGANEYELADMAHWASKVEEGTKEWIVTNKRHLIEQDRDGFRIFATQLDSGVRNEGNAGLTEYLQSLHQAGAHAIRKKGFHEKRSVIAEDSLHQIHGNIAKMLLTPVTLTNAGEHLDGLKQHFYLFKRSTGVCSR